MAQPFLSDCLPDAGGDCLSERAGSSLDTRNPVVLRMTGSLAIQLSEVAYVVERNGWLANRFVLGIHRLDAGEMKGAPQEHGGMAVRQDEAIAIRPNGILWIEPQHAVPDGIDKWRKRHGSTRVSGFGLLHGVNRQGADRVDAQLIELCGR